MSMSMQMSIDEVPYLSSDTDWLIDDTLGLVAALSEASLSIPKVYSPLPLPRVPKSDQKQGQEQELKGNGTPTPTTPRMVTSTPTPRSWEKRWAETMAEAMANEQEKEAEHTTLSIPETPTYSASPPILTEEQKQAMELLEKRNEERRKRDEYDWEMAIQALARSEYDQLHVLSDEAKEGIQFRTEAMRMLMFKAERAMMEKMRTLCRVSVDELGGLNAVRLRSMEHDLYRYRGDYNAVRVLQCLIELLTVSLHVPFEAPSSRLSLSSLTPIEEWKARLQTPIVHLNKWLAITEILSTNLPIREDPLPGITESEEKRGRRIEFTKRHPRQREFLVAKLRLGPLGQSRETRLCLKTFNVRKIRRIILRDHLDESKAARTLRNNLISSNATLLHEYIIGRYVVNLCRWFSPGLVQTLGYFYCGILEPDPDSKTNLPPLLCSRPVEHQGEQALHIISEWIPNSISLQSWLVESHSFIDCCSILIQIFAALSVAEFAGHWKHDDLHTQNVLLTPLTSPVYTRIVASDGRKYGVFTRYQAHIIDWGFSSGAVNGVEYDARGTVGWDFPEANLNTYNVFLRHALHQMYNVNVEKASAASGRQWNSNAARSWNDLIRWVRRNADHQARSAVAVLDQLIRYCNTQWKEVSLHANELRNFPLLQPLAAIEYASYAFLEAGDRTREQDFWRDWIQHEFKVPSVIEFKRAKTSRTPTTSSTPLLPRASAQESDEEKKHIDKADREVQDVLTGLRRDLQDQKGFPSADRLPTPALLNHVRWTNPDTPRPVFEHEKQQVALSLADSIISRQGQGDSKELVWCFGSDTRREVFRHADPVYYQQLMLALEEGTGSVSRILVRHCLSVLSTSEFFLFLVHRCRSLRQWTIDTSYATRRPEDFALEEPLAWWLTRHSLRCLPWISSLVSVCIRGWLDGLGENATSIILASLSSNLREVEYVPERADGRGAASALYAFHRYDLQKLAQQCPSLERLHIAWSHELGLTDERISEDEADVFRLFPALIQLYLVSAAESGLPRILGTRMLLRLLNQKPFASLSLSGFEIRTDDAAGKVYRTIGESASLHTLELVAARPRDVLLDVPFVQDWVRQIWSLRILRIDTAMTWNSTLISSICGVKQGRPPSTSSTTTTTAATALTEKRPLEQVYLGERLSYTTQSQPAAPVEWSQVQKMYDVCPRLCVWPPIHLGRFRVDHLKQLFGERAFVDIHLLVGTAEWMTQATLMVLLLKQQTRFPNRLQRLVIDVSQSREFLDRDLVAELRSFTSLHEVILFAGTRYDGTGIDPNVLVKLLLYKVPPLKKRTLPMRIHMTMPDKDWNRMSRQVTQDVQQAHRVNYDANTRVLYFELFD